MDEVTIQRRIAEADRAILLVPVEIPPDEIRDRQRHVQRPLVPRHFPCVQQGMADKGRIDYGGCKFRNEKGPGLPVEVVPPAVPGTVAALHGLQKIQEPVDLL